MERSMSKEYPDITTMRRHQRFPDPGKVGNPESEAPIYGSHKDAKVEGAYYDVERATWGGNETPTRVENEDD